MLTAVGQENGKRAPTLKLSVCSVISVRCGLLSLSSPDDDLILGCLNPPENFCLSADLRTRAQMKLAGETQKNSLSRLACSLLIARLPLTASETRLLAPKIGVRSACFS